MARTYRHLETTDQPTRAALLRWSSVFGGVVIGGAILLLLSALWFALAAATGVEAIADGLGWYIAVSAVVALFVGGWLAGALSGVPGIGPGIVNGLAVWGVILVASTLVGAPGALNLAMAPGIELPALEPGQTLWPAFWSLLIGAVTAGAGGALGGLTTRGAPAPIAERAYDERGREPSGERGWREERGDRGYRDDERDWRDERDRGYRDDERDWRGSRGERTMRGDRGYRDEGYDDDTRDRRDDLGQRRESALREGGSYRDEGDREREQRSAGRYPDDRPPPPERSAPSERSYAERTSSREARPDTDDRPDGQGR